MRDARHVLFLALLVQVPACSMGQKPAQNTAQNTAQNAAPPEKQPATPAKPDASCSRTDPYDATAMQADVAYLADPSLDGRVPGSAGGDLAIEYIRERFECLGLARLGNMTTYVQPFTDPTQRKTANIVAVVPGSDPAVASEYVVVTAHHDHFGGGKLGANDNASGIAGLLAIAQALKQGAAPRRSVVLLAAGSEEPPHESEDLEFANGTRYLRQHPPTGFDPTNVVYNVNMDMIGTYGADSDGSLSILGAFPDTYGKTAVQTVKALAAHASLTLVDLGKDSDQSDNVVFCEEGVPYLFAWTEDPQCYHKPCDNAAHIDSSGMSRVARFVGDLTLDIANTTTDLEAGVKVGQNVCLVP